ncbi:PRC-barrel domain-containing protein [Aliidiomarina indica]|uniref:PRC-barrel domain-containing protein n=1 Tax=Aliidiomarina indica TaxID=2749147 RepID=UPI00188F3F95|nr:PRC-barrel domain-containing protein [Aliidiomarina indica]
MKKLHTFAFYALVTPLLTLSASSALAHNATDLEDGRFAQSPQISQSTNSNANSDRLTSPRDQSSSPSRSYLDSVPYNGMHASNLIGTNVHTSDNEDIGSVKDLIIGQDGQVVAVVVSVGGFLGMGEKDVALGWDNLTRSGIADKQELRVDVTRADLKAAPAFVKPEKYRTAQTTPREQNSPPKRAQASVQQDTQLDTQKRRQQPESNRQHVSDNHGEKNRGHLVAVPSLGFHTDSLMGMDVYTSDNESIGSVDDLIIDESGKIVAIIVSVGGFLGIGQKDVAISWDHVTRSGVKNEQKLNANVTRENLKSAPKFASH